jgi:hypothetical protein
LKLYSKEKTFEIKRTFKLIKLKGNERLRRGFNFKFKLDCKLENSEERREENILEAISREFNPKEFPSVRMLDENQRDQQANATEKDL